TARPDALFMAAQLFQRSEQRPGARRVVVALGEKAQQAAAAAGGRLEAEDRLDAFRAGARRMARRGARRIGAKAGSAHARRFERELRSDRASAAQGADLPAERQHVAPVAVGAEERYKRGSVARIERVLEAREPVVGDGGE